MIIVKVFKTSEKSAVILSKDGSIRRPVVLEETLRNKMCRRDRAYFAATITPDEQVALHQRVNGEKW